MTLHVPYRTDGIIHEANLIPTESVTFLFFKKDTESPIKRKIYVSLIVWI